jgi:acyl carrier protein
LFSNKILTYYGVRTVFLHYITSVNITNIIEYEKKSKQCYFGAYKIMSDNLYQIVSNIFNVPVSEINDESSPESIETWDSFTIYILLDEIESTYDIKISLDETLEIKKFGDIKSLLLKHGVSI